MERSKIFKTLESSPYLPAISPDLQFLLKMLDPQGSATVKEVSELIANIPQVKNDLLAFVNSNLFALGGKATTTRDALILLGLRAARIFVVTRIADRLLPKEGGRSGSFAREAYRRHVLGTASAAEAIGEKLKKGEKAELFAYGLVHDIGVALMDRCLPEALDEVMELELHKKMHQIVAEKRVLDGLTHADLGAWLCDRWQFPRDVREAVACHHAPMSAVLAPAEVKLLHIGDLISTNYYARLLGLNYTNIYPLRTLESVGLSLNDVEQIGQALPARVEEIHKHL